MLYANRTLQVSLFAALWLLLAAACTASKTQTADMTFKQRMLKAVYPFFMKLSGGSATRLQHEAVAPPVPFYSLLATGIDGKPIDFAAFKGKKVLLVNTASDCGYTGQYAELEQLHRQYGGQLVVLGFPANDFKEQEKGDNASIAQFCQRNYGVSFPLAEKAQVVKGAGQHPVYQWLTDSTRNGWNSKAPSWNFSKYLVNEQGALVRYFDPAVSPLSKEVVAAVRP